MHRRNIFRRTLLERLADWQCTRTPWAWMAGLAFFILAVSHFVFEGWFLMPPCEECVYIRLGFFSIMIGSLIALIGPQFFILRLIGYLKALWGACYGIYHAVVLNDIHAALRSGDPSALFGVKNCSLTPDFPWGLPLADWFPSLFLPKGPCGSDLPVIEPGTVLGGWQASVIESIREAGGWYLFPGAQTGTMADCAALIFTVALIWLLLSVFSELFSKKFSRSFF